MDIITDDLVGSNEELKDIAALVINLPGPITARLPSPPRPWVTLDPINSCPFFVGKRR